MHSPARPSRRFVDLGIAIAFVASIAAPMLVAARAGFPFDVLAENRYPAPLPVFSPATFATFPPALEAWVNDHFGFRNTLIRHANLTRIALHVSPRSDLVIGKHGFIFYAGDRAMESFRHTARFDPATLAQWAMALELRRAFLATHGIRYIVVFNPDKETIYPEMMPDALNRLNAPSPLQQLIAALRLNVDLDILDTTDVVRRAKEAGQLVFNKTDSHWNGFGRFAAANAVLNDVHRWFPSVSELSPADFRFTRTTEPGGDLAVFLAMPLDLPEVDHVDVVPAQPRAHETEVLPIPVYTNAFTQPRLYHVDDSSLPRVLILGDSFMGGCGLANILAERFQNTFFTSGHDLTEELLLKERPTLVIDGWVERYVLSAPPTPPAPATPVPVIDGVPLPLDGAPFSLGRVDAHDLQAESGGWRAVGQDPYIVITTSPVTTKPSRSVVIDMQVSPNGIETVGALTAQLFFTPKESAFSEAASVHFPIIADDHPHRYRVTTAASPLWTGTIDAFRLDFPDGLPGFSYRVTAMALTDAP